MLFRSIALLFSLIVCCLSCHSQDGYFEFGARSAGMAHSTINSGDAYSLYNNIGALSEVKETTVFAGYRLPYGLVELGSIGAGFVKPTKYGNAGLGFFRFGGESLSQQLISLGFSNKFGLVSLGAKVSYLQYSIETIGSTSSIVIDFGGVAELSKFLRFGAHVFNITRTQFSSDVEDNIPLVMKTGLSFLPTDELTINVEAVKSLEQDAQFRAGLEYFLIKKLALRTGIESRPVKASFGVGFYTRRFVLDYAYSNHSVLNDIHDFSVAMRFL